MTAAHPSERDIGRNDARDEKRKIIHRAAIATFSDRGIARTSMAAIADAAGMSRPALYQYFSDKHDIFASAFIALFDEHVDRSLAELTSGGSTAERLDGMLQRFDGDLWERLAASPHADEIMSAKSEQLSASITEVVTRLWDGVAEHLMGCGAPDRVTGWVALLRMSPAGLKIDQPTVDEFRSRLSVLGHSVGSDVDALT